MIPNSILGHKNIKRRTGIVTVARPKFRFSCCAFMHGYIHGNQKQCLVPGKSKFLLIEFHPNISEVSHITEDVS